MTVHSILEMLVTAEEARTSEEVVASLEKLLSIYGFDYYAILKHARQNDEGEFSFLASRWPEGWPEIYMAQRHQLIDPALRYLAVAHRPFRWKHAVKAFQADPQSKRMERMMAEAATFGLKDGYIFPVHGRVGLLGFLTVGGKPVDLSPTEMSLFQAASKTAYWKLRHVQSAGEGEAKDHPEGAAPDMTRRELEVLMHLADGRTSNEISGILNISRHTVDWYMSGIQSKLGARNRQHAVAIAFRSGMIF